ncbi:MAG: DUF1186 domain-containing protein [Victivallales bacterium]
MNLESCIESLKNGIIRIPDDEINWLRDNWADAEPVLIDSFRKALDSKEDFSESLYMFCVIYLLAEKKSPAAYPLFIELCRKPEEKLDDIPGYLGIGELSRLFATVSNGDIEPLKDIIQDGSLFIIFRVAALEAIEILYIQGSIERAVIVDCLKFLINEGLAREENPIWDYVASTAFHIHPEELMVELRKAYKEGLVDPCSISLETMEAELLNTREETLEETGDFTSDFITDTEYEAEWFVDYLYDCLDDANFKDEPDEFYDEDDDDAWEPNHGAIGQETYVRETPKIGRNDPCPCGSGNKYKKCCLQKKAGTAGEQVE